MGAPPVLRPVGGARAQDTVILGAIDIRPYTEIINVLTILLMFGAGYQLDLRFNPDLTNIQALFENPGIGVGDIVELRHTNVSCVDQARLAEKGVEVRTELFSSCATATRQR